MPLLRLGGEGWWLPSSVLSLALPPLAWGVTSSHAVGSPRRCACSQSCLTLCDPMNRSPPVSSVHGIFPGKNTGGGCCFLLQGIFLTQGWNLCPLHWQVNYYFFFFLTGGLLLYNLVLVSAHLSVNQPGRRIPYHRAACGVLWKAPEEESPSLANTPRMNRKRLFFLLSPCRNPISSQMRPAKAGSLTVPSWEALSQRHSAMCHSDFWLPETAR